MGNSRAVLAGVAVMFATIMVASMPAYAQQRKLLVLIDASGSMAAPRDSTTRFEAAKTLAKARVTFFENQVDPRPLRVAVYTFRGNNELPVLHTDATFNHGFVDSGDAKDAIDCLRPDPLSLPFCSSTPDAGTPFQVGGNTPLALAMCQVVDIFSNPLFNSDIKHLQLSSDGEENSTTSGLCQGVRGGVFNEITNMYDPSDAWQNKVISRYTTPSPGISTHVDLFEIRNLPFQPPSVLDPEGVLTPEARFLAATPSISTGLTPLEQFFTLIVQATGGKLTVIHDDAPLPVSGDLNDDRCVDRTDAILVARAFGPVVPPGDGRFDLNLDRTVDFADYMIQRSLITSTPACGPDPFTPRAPVVCSGPGQIVIDGQAVENGGISIEVRSACQIIIRNSLIVAGQNAIKIDGSAVVRVDNSIIVGQNAVLGTTGTIILSAANTIFHGALSTNGAFSYINRGGNVFE